jgi:hypothetical protein
MAKLEYGNTLCVNEWGEPAMVLIYTAGSVDHSKM